MKCIEDAKYYWKENKDEIIRNVKSMAICAGVGFAGYFVGALTQELKAAHRLIDDDKCIMAGAIGRADDKARGEHDKGYVFGANRDKCPEFDKIFEQVANTGVVTDDNGVTRKVIGAIIYGEEDVIED